LPFILLHLIFTIQKANIKENEKEFEKKVPKSLNTKYQAEFWEKIK